MVGTYSCRDLDPHLIHPHSPCLHHSGSQHWYTAGSDIQLHRDDKFPREGELGEPLQPYRETVRVRGFSKYVNLNQIWILQQYIMFNARNMIQEANGSPESKQHYQKLARYTEGNATLNNIFYMNISIWRTVGWNWQCFTKRVFTFTMSAKYKCMLNNFLFQFFSKFTQSHLTT